MSFQLTSPAFAADGEILGSTAVTPRTSPPLSGPTRPTTPRRWR